MLTCPRCGSQNRDSARFCQECGASFSPDRLLPDLDLIPPSGKAVHQTTGVEQGAKVILPVEIASGQLSPLQLGSVLYHPENVQRRYGIAKIRELERSIYYDAFSLRCSLCHNQHEHMPEHGLCQRCRVPLEPVLVHERRYLSESLQSEAHWSRLIQLSSEHQGILPHLDVIPYMARIFTVTQYPGRWRILVRGRQMRSLEDVLAGAVQVGQALEYLHSHNFAYTEVGGASIESLILVGSGMKIKLADLSPMVPLPSDDSDVRQTLINRDIAFLGSLLFYLATGKPLPRNSVDIAPLILHPLIEKAMQGQCRTVAEIVKDLMHLPSDLGRPLKPSHGQAVNVGKERDSNQDSIATFTLDKEQEGGSMPIGFYLVADGMGGYEAGDVASLTVNQIVTNWIVETRVLPDLRKITRRLATHELPGGLLVKAFEQANAALVNLKQAKQSELGSTITAALVIGDVVTIANVGDSRTYLLRGAKLEQITEDHSLVARLLETGVIEPDEVRTHPRRNEIYRCLGCKPTVEVDTFTVRLQRGDYLILCSDGLWEMVHDDEIQRLVEQSRSPQQACDALVGAANRAGGDDNIAVIVVEME